MVYKWDKKIYQQAHEAAQQMKVLAMQTCILNSLPSFYSAGENRVPRLSLDFHIHTYHGSYSLTYTTTIIIKLEGKKERENNIGALRGLYSVRA